MLSSLLITFRETLEMALLVGIILSYLSKTKQTKYNNLVYMGIVSGIISSIIVAIIAVGIFGKFEGIGEQIFEGIVMMIGAILLTSMILWMLKQKNISKELHEKISLRLKNSDKIGLFLLVFLSILREGIETVIFLGASNLTSTDYNLLGGLFGIILAIILGILIFVGSMKINIKKFFNITSILLILFAAGLVIQSIHEFEEAGILSPIKTGVINLNSFLNLNSFFGELLKGLFGLSNELSLLQIIGYVIYLIIVIIFWYKIKNKKF